ncbi:helix-turn-helix domain-containing protein, partial [Klebsiella pneumoniae]|uniref:helix-turn-helix domain-containing protein n=1 Tax=Klebsiella pneumoniae TaxID=573 RepID=UPI0037460AFB
LVLQQRTYSVIRNHLLEMMLLSEETRQRVSILEYIQDRTLLSYLTLINFTTTNYRRRFLRVK